MDGRRKVAMARLLDEIRELLPVATPVLGPDPWGWAGFVQEEWAEVYGGPAQSGYRTGGVLRRSPDCEECPVPSGADIALIVASVNYAALAAVGVPADQEAQKVSGEADSRCLWGFVHDCICRWGECHRFDFADPNPTEGNDHD